MGTNSSSMTITPPLHKQAPYDTVKDFAPIITPVILGHYTAVGYPSGPRTAAQTALLANAADFTFDTPNVITHVKAGRLKALAVTLHVRWPELPEVPAVAEFYAGFDATFWTGL